MLTFLWVQGTCWWRAGRADHASGTSAERVLARLDAARAAGRPAGVSPRRRAEPESPRRGTRPPTSSPTSFPGASTGSRRRWASWSAEGRLIRLEVIDEGRQPGSLVRPRRGRRPARPHRGGGVGAARDAAVAVRQRHPQPRPDAGAVRLPLPHPDLHPGGEAAVRVLRDAGAGRGAHRRQDRSRLRPEGQPLGGEVGPSRARRGRPCRGARAEAEPERAWRGSWARGKVDRSDRRGG